MSMEEYEFETTDAGAADVTLVDAGSLHKGDLVMIKGHPCKICAFDTAKVGKHGSAKAMITGIDIFTGQKYECTYSTSDTVDAPSVKRTEMQLVNIDEDDYMTLLQENGELKENLKVPDSEHLKEVAKRIHALFEAEGEKEIIVNVLSGMGFEMAVAVREGKCQ